ncbi:flagellar export chaperone FlgN [Erwinia aphidicola]|jgi:flagellar biosynthesis/type III secretory pathway chaperone|uniref:Flagellar export chaperone FlgN n=1 Tax=Erwinia aphidicola TaxID=68334 RepID=A0ABU8DLC1_ERWAP|nr:flagellar export chaperone FlgN [Erwinia aphidicola]MBD1378404.1 flagellar export chaperone FlgN [Erwinia aphidicola]PIJ57862.1 flagella synthesis protein [Erwinia sp. OLMDLW33]CAH0209977.1 Flagella synthesis protein FlgN [Erwinia aphidicola]
MDKLHSILSQMKTSLSELEAIMIEEVNQLNRPQINPVSLQVLTDNKSQLLSTIQYYDELRRQEEAERRMAAPYRQQGKLFSCWQQVTGQIQATKDLNGKVEELLNIHMKKNQQLKKVVDGVNGNNIYGSAGEAHRAPTARAYNISV